MFGKGLDPPNSKEDLIAHTLHPAPCTQLETLKPKLETLNPESAQMTEHLHRLGRSNSKRDMVLGSSGAPSGDDASPEGKKDVETFHKYVGKEVGIQTLNPKP